MKLILSAFFSQALLVTTAAAECGTQMATAFAERVAGAYQVGSLPSIDVAYPNQGSIQIVIEHSVSDAPSLYANAKTFSELADMLSAKKTDGFPTAAVWPLDKCSDVACDFGGNGASLSHNNLFLKRIEYRCANGAVLVTNIFFIDGD